MEGFFSKKEVSVSGMTNGRMHSCASCGLYKDCQTPKMQPTGGFKKKILIVGEAPSKTDDKVGGMWNSKTGRLLEEALAESGISLTEDCLSVNAVNCYPAKTKVTNHHTSNCYSVVVAPALQKYKPRVVLLLGWNAVSSVLSPYFSGAVGNTDKFVGYLIPINGTWYCPLPDPGRYDTDKKASQHLITFWRRELKKALQQAQTPPPIQNTPQVEIVRDIKFLTDLPGGLYAIDYETTGLKPDMKGHDIISCAISSGPDHAWSFLMPEKKRDRQPLREFLYRKDIKLMAHNMAYEDTWSRVVLKVAPRGWFWDSMQAAHILDNRPGVTGLKFQSFVNFGQEEYSQDVEEYFRSGNEFGNNTINKIRTMLQTQTGIGRLLEYGGLDAVLEYRLALKQFDQIGVNV